MLTQEEAAIVDEMLRATTREELVEEALSAEERGFYEKWTEAYREFFGNEPHISLREFRMCKLYYDLTGWMEPNPAAIWHHVVSLYGPPCESCGKPLRTRMAALCAACGHPRRS
ncbi:hypothetical protein [Deferrisoma palaeochoriense]